MVYAGMVPSATTMDFQATADRVVFATDLPRHRTRTALLQDSPDGPRSVTYAELASLVAAESARLGPTRRLVMVSLDRTIEAVTTYLATLAGGHVALLSPERDVEGYRQLINRYDPDVVATRTDAVWSVTERHEGTRHTLGPELAALLSTSGSTGSPKLVRLSAQNLQSNAESIVTALQISPDDRAVTTLPLTYSYGLSVLHSHLAVGASLLLTDRSVVEAQLWDAIARHEVTTLPGVPYTFDLLDRVGFDRQNLPHLRNVTLAGGRLAPERVRHYAELGLTKGYRLHVMYGQTEATARIATLAPQQALEHPEAIGRPIPGGEIELVPVDGADADADAGADAGVGVGVGEIVYRGPNIMLGYAEGPADLARGRDVTALHTGDLATRDGSGTYRIVGRRSRNAKVFGLRIDLDHIEHVLSEVGITACVISDDNGLCVVGEGPIDPDHLRERTARATGLPVHVIGVRVVDSLPRLPSGKLDRATAPNGCAPAAPSTHSSPDTAAGTRPTAQTLTTLYATMLGRPDATADDTFVALGGDSLSYVEISVRLEALLGDLPANWHVQTPRQLATSADTGTRRRWTVRLETGVLLRALAIVAIVGTHIGLFDLLGGAHVLLGLAGFSMARFLLDPADPTPRAPRVLRGAARIALPSMLWIGTAAIVTRDYGWSNVFLLGNALGPDAWGPTWHYWFVEALVLFLLASAALLAVPAFDRAERAHSFATSGALVAVGLVVRFGYLPGLEDPRPSPAPAIYFAWFFVLGWWAARATNTWQRLSVSAVVLLAIPGYWGSVERESAVVLGLLVLIWLPTVRIPRLAVPLVTKLAAASLAIYLTHWTVFPLVEQSPLAALAVSLAFGVLVYELARAAMKVAKSRSFWSAYDSAYAARARSALSPDPR